MCYFLEFLPGDLRVAYYLDRRCASLFSTYLPIPDISFYDAIHICIRRVGPCDWMGLLQYTSPHLFSRFLLLRGRWIRPLPALIRSCHPPALQAAALCLCASESLWRSGLFLPSIAVLLPSFGFLPVTSTRLPPVSPSIDLFVLVPLLVLLSRDFRPVLRYVSSRVAVVPGAFVLRMVSRLF